MEKKDHQSEKEQLHEEVMLAEEALAAETARTGADLGKEVDRLRTELEASKASAQQNWDKTLRALAELENVKRRAERDVEQAHKFATEKLLNSLLPVLDSMEQALELTAKSGMEAVHEGLEMTLKMLTDAVEKAGVIRINPLNQPFDPSLHEAMAAQPVENIAPNTVMAVFQKGYQLNGRLVRPARVVVSK